MFKDFKKYRGLLIWSAIALVLAVFCLVLMNTKARVVYNLGGDYFEVPIKNMFTKSVYNLLLACVVFFGVAVIASIFYFPYKNYILSAISGTTGILLLAENGVMISSIIRDFNDYWQSMVLISVIPTLIIPAVILIVLTIRIALGKGKKEQSKEVKDNLVKIATTEDSVDFSNFVSAQASVGVGFWTAICALCAATFGVETKNVGKKINKAKKLAIARLCAIANARNKKEIANVRYQITQTSQVISVVVYGELK